MFDRFMNNKSVRVLRLTNGKTGVARTLWSVMYMRLCVLKHTTGPRY